MTDPNVEAVRQRFQQRAAVGLEKYGTDTTRTDLSRQEWLQHLQDELMDGAVYAERLKQELDQNQLVQCLNTALERLDEAKGGVHHSFQKTHVALRNLATELHHALILAGG